MTRSLKSLLFPDENATSSDSLRSTLLWLVFVTIIVTLIYVFFYNSADQSSGLVENSELAMSAIFSPIVPLLLIGLTPLLIFLGYRTGYLLAMDKRAKWYWPVGLFFLTLFAIAGGFVIGKIKTKQWLKNGSWNRFIIIIIVIFFLALELLKNALVLFILWLIGIVPALI